MIVTVDDHWNDITKLIHRLDKIGIHLKINSQLPFIYLSSVNGNIVTEKYQSENGWVIGFLRSQFDLINDDRKLFKLIRKYNNKERKNGSI